MNNWYTPDDYEHSPSKKPQGSKNDTKKVIHGYRGSIDGILTITRGKDAPDTEFGNGFRCVENL